MNLKEAATCSHEHCGVWMEIRSDSFLWPNIHIAFVYVFWGWNSNSCPKQILSGTKNRLSWAVTQKRNCTDTHKYTSGDISGQHESLWKYWPSACLYRLSSMKNWLAKCHVLSYWKSEAFQRVIEDEMSPRRGRHTRGEGMRNAFLCMCGAASSRVNASQCVSTLFPWSCWQCVDVLALFNEQISGLTREDNEKQHCGERVRVPKQLFEFSAPC